MLAHFSTDVSGGFKRPASCPSPSAASCLCIQIEYGTAMLILIVNTVQTANGDLVKLVLHDLLYVSRTDTMHNCYNCQWLAQ